MKKRACKRGKAEENNGKPNIELKIELEGPSPLGKIFFESPVAADFSPPCKIN